MGIDYCLKCKGTGHEMFCSGGTIYYIKCEECTAEQKNHSNSQEAAFGRAMSFALLHSDLDGSERDYLLKNRDSLIYRLIETLHGRKFEETEKKVDRTNPHKRTFQMHLLKRVSLVRTEKIHKSDPADLIKRVYAKRHDRQ